MFEIVWFGVGICVSWELIDGGVDVEGQLRVLNVLRHALQKKWFVESPSMRSSSGADTGANSRPSLSVRPVIGRAWICTVSRTVL
jgi:hypothetical protein